MKIFNDNTLKIIEIVLIIVGIFSGWVYGVAIKSNQIENNKKDILEIKGTKLSELNKYIKSNTDSVIELKTISIITKEQFEQINVRFDKLENKFDRKFDAILKILLEQK